LGRRFAVIGAAIALAALAVGVVSPALGSSGDDDEQRTFRAVAINTEVSFVDVGDQGNSLGDEIVFTSNLWRHRKNIGHQGGVCKTVSVEGGEAQCVATYWLRDGQITGQALITLGDPTPYAGAITGGTGSYEGAEGEVHVRPISDTKGRLTFHVES
jgi:hypothetical protein